MAGASLPSVVLDHVSQLDDELSLFVLLTALKRVFLEQKHTKKNRNFSYNTYRYTLITETHSMCVIKI